MCTLDMDVLLYACIFVFLILTCFSILKSALIELHCVYFYEVFPRVDSVARAPFLGFDNELYCDVYPTRDVRGAIRTARYPNGLTVPHVTACAQACLDDPQCVVAVFNMGGGDRCWPLQYFTQSVSSGSRAVLYPKNVQWPIPVPTTTNSSTEGGGDGGGCTPNEGEEPSCL